MLCTYFDDDETEKFYGMIVSQFDAAVFVKWKDGYSRQVDLDGITLEPDYSPSCNSNENIIENIKTEPKNNKAKSVKGLQLLRSALTNEASASISNEDSVEFGQDLTYESDEEEKECAKPVKERKNRTKGH